MEIVILIISTFGLLCSFVVRLLPYRIRRRLFWAVAHWGSVIRFRRRLVLVILATSVAVSGLYSFTARRIYAACARVDVDSSGRILEVAERGP